VGAVAGAIPQDLGELGGGRRLRASVTSTELAND
jgi:hypothetical protein